MSDSQGFPPPPPPPPSFPATPSGGRTPPPWERPGPPVQRYVDNVKAVLSQSALFFRQMSREGGLGPPLIYAIIGVVIGSIGNYLTQMMMPFGSFGRYGGGFF